VAAHFKKRSRRTFNFQKDSKIMKLTFSLLAVANARPTPTQLFEKAFVEIVDYFDQNLRTFQNYVDLLDVN